MTYCVGLELEAGLVMLADTRTNAGMDNISCFGKLHRFETPGERLIAVMSAGNLAVAQSVLNFLTEGLDDGTGEAQTLWTVPSMFEAARLVGRAVRNVFELDGAAMEAQRLSFEVSFLVGGQIRGRRMRLFQVYAAGNFIEATSDTPFLQIGEHKYGKPILDRAVTRTTSLGDGVKLALISMDSTLRSNLTVGLPIDLLVYRRDTMEVPLARRITVDDRYFAQLRGQWSEALRDAYRSISDPDWEEFGGL